MTKEKLSYGKYLQLDRILDSQVPKSKETKNVVHDEMLFIIIHQVYELWFKQILHELDSVLDMFKGNYVQEENLGTVVNRFDRIIEIPLPDDEGRKSILDIHMGKMPKSKNLSIKKIVTLTKGFSGADLKATCVEAAMIAIRAKRKSVNSKDFITAIERISEKKSNSIRGDAPENLFH